MLTIRLKYYLLLFYIVFSGILECSQAQSFTPKEQRHIDSLFKITKDVKSHDTSKVRAYVGLSEVLYVVDIDTIIPLCIAAKEIAELNLTLQLNEKEKSCFSKALGTAYNNIGYVYDEKGQYESALEYYNLALELHKMYLDKVGQATALNNIGYLYRYKGDIELALMYYLQSLEIRIEIGENESIANSLNNLAAIYNDQGNVEKALSYYQQGLKIYEETGDKVGQGLLLNNIGYLNFKVDDIEAAQKYYWKSLAIRKATNDKKGISNSYGNIGMLYKQKGMIDSALYYYKSSIALDQEIGFKQGEASSLVNLGGVYMMMGDTLKAQEIFQKSLEMNLILEEKSGIAACLQSLALIALKKGNIVEAMKLSHRSLVYSQELGFPKEIKAASEILYLGYRSQNKWKDALLMFELFSQMKDSLWNDQNRKLSVKQQFKYSYDQKATADSVAQAKELEIKNTEIAFKDSEAKSQKLLLNQSEQLKWYLFLIIGLVVVFAVFMYRRFRITQKQKEVIDGQRIEVEQKKKLIEDQHFQLEETHQEISDSIRYAQRLQQAILPPSVSLSENLGKGFVLFKPKDVVSGDFYWMQRVNNKVFFAVADCTGHGVPGAMVSVVCSNALNRAVKEFHCLNTNTILDKTRELVIETFANSDQDVKDGMDISICALSIDPISKSIDVTQGLEFSGANNPIWIVREKSKVTAELMDKIEIFGNETSILYELKGDRQPVGTYFRNTPFSIKKEELFKGDIIYLFSDGYADQFGGKQGKKLKYKPFKKMLVSMAEIDMHNQEIQLNTNFDQWKSDFEQVDDVCVIGVKI